MTQRDEHIVVRGETAPGINLRVDVGDGAEERQRLVDQMAAEIQKQPAALAVGQRLARLLRGTHDFDGIFPLYIFSGTWVLVLSWRLRPRLGAFEPHPSGTHPAPANIGLATAGLSYARGAWSGAMTARYVGAQDLDPLRELGSRAGGFVEANARLTWRTRLVYPVRFDLDVRNVFDSAGTSAASFIYTPATLPIEGRRVLLSSEILF